MAVLFEVDYQLGSWYTWEQADYIFLSTPAAHQKYFSLNENKNALYQTA
ncbi:MAG: hypothetical protein ABI921_04595 [Panacibacter sp.]